MADPSHAQAVEAAKKWKRGGKEFTLKHGDTMASYLLSAPAPSCDAEWARDFIGRCREVTCHGFYDDRFDYTEDELTAELTAKFAGRSDDGEAVTPQWVENVLNIGDCMHVRNIKRYNLFPESDGTVRVLFHACAGPLCWEPSIWFGTKQINANPTRGDVRRLLAALGITEPAK